MKKITAGFVFLLSLSACVATGGNSSYTAELQRWVGRPAYQLYQVWGEPASVYSVTPREKIVTYVRTSLRGSNRPYDRQLYYQGMDENWWNRVFGPPQQRQDRVYYCKVLFTVRDAVVVNFEFNGDDCVANG